MKPLLVAAALLLGAAAGALAAPPASPKAVVGAVELWVDLGEPAAASGAERRQRRQAEQDRVGERIRELGGEVTVRLRHARHALLVRIAPEKVADLRRIPGVVRVRPAHTLHPPGLTRSPAP